MYRPCLMYRIPVLWYGIIQGFINVYLQNGCRLHRK